MGLLIFDKCSDCGRHSHWEERVWETYGHRCYKCFERDRTNSIEGPGPEMRLGRFVCFLLAGGHVAALNYLGGLNRVLGSLLCYGLMLVWWALATVAFFWAFASQTNE